MISFKLLILCLSFLAQSNSEDAEPMLQDFIFSDDVDSHLFKPCLDAMNAVSGILYSISPTDDTRYQKFLPKTLESFAFETVELVPGGGLVECAIEAGKLYAGMFKYDETDGCRISYSLYKEDHEQACSEEEAAEVVYVCREDACPPSINRACFSGPPNDYSFSSTSYLPVKDFLALFVSSPTCCHMIIDGVCIYSWGDMENQITYDINTCEASVICEALGWPDIPFSYYLDPTIGAQFYDQKDQWYEMVTPVRRLADGSWINTEDNSAFDTSLFSSTPDDDEYCMEASPRSNGFGYYPLHCEKDRIHDGALCIQENTNLPLC